MSVDNGCWGRRRQRLRSEEPQRQEEGSSSSGEPTKLARGQFRGSERGKVAHGPRSGTPGSIGIAAAHHCTSQRLASWGEESVHGLGERPFSGRKQSRWTKQWRWKSNAYAS